MDVIVILIGVFTTAGGLMLVALPGLRRQRRLVEEAITSRGGRLRRIEQDMLDETTRRIARGHWVVEYLAPSGEIRKARLSAAGGEVTCLWDRAIEAYLADAASEAEAPQGDQRGVAGLTASTQAAERSAYQQGPAHMFALQQLRSIAGPDLEAIKLLEGVDLPARLPEGKVDSPTFAGVLQQFRLLSADGETNRGDLDVIVSGAGLWADWVCVGAEPKRELWIKRKM